MQVSGCELHAGGPEPYQFRIAWHIQRAGALCRPENRPAVPPGISRVVAKGLGTVDAICRLGYAGLSECAFMGVVLVETVNFVSLVKKFDFGCVLCMCFFLND